MSGAGAQMGMNYIVVDSKWYDALGLRPGASLEEIRSAYRDMVKVWHPDRFNTDPRVRQKAEAKLKELNEAYQGLLSSSSKSGPPSTKSEPRPQLQTGQPSGSPRRLTGFDPFGRESQRVWVPPKTAPPADAPREQAPRPKASWGKIALVSALAALAMVAAVWLWPTAMTMISGNSNHPTTPAPFPQPTSPTPPPVSQPPAAASPAPAPAPQPPAPVGSGPNVPSGPAFNQAAEPYNGVIMLVTVRPFRPREYGTAFLVDGTTAITTSHVVTDAALHQFSLVAVTPDYHTYRARVVCRSPLFGRGQPQGEADASKDVALVKIDWNSPVKSVKIDTQSATQEGATPSSTPLPLSRLGPRPGDKVAIVGYGRQKSGVIQLRQIGVVTNVWKTADGTAVFSGKFPKPPNPGERGAPVLNRAGEVVGLWAWDAPTGDGSGGGISAQSLTCP